jgi:hypothetical protein
MNPFLILAGVVALIAYSSSKKGQPTTGSGSAPAPSPANPAGLDAPLGPSPSGVPEVRETTSDPIPSPANPAGLDAPLGPSPSGVPEVIVAEPEEFVVVEDGSWSASPEAPQEVVTISTPTQQTTPTLPPVTLNSIGSSYFNTTETAAFYNQLKATGVYNQTDFFYWLRFKVLPEYSSGIELGMAQAPYYRFLLRKLKEDKDMLNQKGIDAYVKHKQAKDAKQNAAPPVRTFPSIQGGLVHRGNGVYSPPANAEDCPEGSVYLVNRPYFQGNFGCISQARYEEIVKQKIPQINPMPASVWQDVIKLTYAGNFNDRKVLTMPASELIKEIKSRAEGCSNQWCKVVQDLFFTDTTIFANDRFTFKDVVWATMDGNYIAFYPVPVKVGSSKRKEAPVYAMFSVSKADYDAYKEFYDISKK